MNELALFAGAGGGILAGQLLGWRTVCAVEREPYAAGVLLARQNDGLLPPFPVWDDVCTFDGRPWRGIIDVVSGGFPCQDISVAGAGAGLDGKRSGLWKEFSRIIGEVRPRYAFIENSPALLLRGLDRVLCDLAALGFDAEWGIVSASDCGAHHKRERIWIVANANGLRELQPARRVGEQRNGIGQCCEIVADTDRERFARQQWASEAWKTAATCGRCEALADASGEGLPQSEQIAVLGERRRKERRTVTECGGWATEPDVGRVANGVAFRVDRLKAIGNGQVPQSAAAAWRILTSNAG